MANPGPVNTDSLLKDLGGCGLFQVLLVVLGTIPIIPFMFVFPLLTFGIYNPGWRCLDNVTSASANQTLFPNQTVFSHRNSVATQTPFPNQTSESTDSHTSAVYRTDTCLGYDSCRRVEFNPEASTLVTEWGLVCSQSWIPSLIISLKMAGETFGQLVVGYTGDRFGRKAPYLSAIVIMSGIQLTLLFSISWEMFAVLILLSGITTSFVTLLNVLTTEMVPALWRIRVSSLPTWTIGNMIACGVIILTKDWRYLVIVICCWEAAASILLIWVPESLMWLIVNGKKTETRQVVEKIARINRVEPLNQTALDEVFRVQEAEEKKTSSVTILHLFRKGYRCSTIFIGMAYFSLNLVYFALSFGVSKLPGDVYVNMIILSVTELPSNFISIWLGNAMGRKKTAISFYTLQAFNLIGVALVDIFVSGGKRDITIMVLVVVSKVVCNVIWYVMTIWSLELYPTIARCTIVSFAMLSATCGSIFAPYLIPSDPDTLHICYLVMGGLILACGFLLCFIPETKGRPYMDTWEESDGDKQRGNPGEKNENKIV